MRFNERANEEISKMKVEGKDSERHIDVLSSEEFKRNVLDIAARIGVRAQQIQLRKMNRKLASCSSRGRLSFDPSILTRPSEERLKIIIHELLHLRYPNHGVMFKLMFDTYFSQLAQ